jgi:hypothetical protein
MPYDISDLAKPAAPKAAEPAATGYDISNLAKPGAPEAPSAPAPAAGYDISAAAKPVATTTVPPGQASPDMLYATVRTAAKNLDDLVADLNEFAKAPTIGGKAWAALKASGSALSIPLSPVEAVGTELVGRPLEAATGIPAEWAGEAASFGALLVVAPISIVSDIGRAARATRLVSETVGTLAPETVSEASA